MKRKLISGILAFVLLGSWNMEVNASENQDAAEQVILKEGVYEGENLELVAEQLGYEMMTEDGYVLDKVSVTYQLSEETDSQVSTVKPMRRAIGDYVGGVSKVSSDIYFPDSPIASNWFDGPLSELSKTYSRTVSATYSCTTTVSAEVLDAGLSFSVTDSTTESTTWKRPAITSSQRINVKEYGVYDKYAFTVYNILGKEKGTGNAYKPMGLYVAQATYSK